MATTPTPIGALPTAPAPDQPQATFDANAYTWSSALPAWTTEANNLATNVYNNAAEAESKATLSGTKADAAAAAAQLASDWATKTTSPDGTASKSAKSYAEDAAAQVTLAQGFANDASQSAIDAVNSVEKYQGSLASDPALDKTGNPLTAGDWYVNTATGFIRAYNGSFWVQGISTIAGVSSINGETGDVTGVVKENTTQTLTNKTLTNPLLFLGGSNGTVGQVPVSQGAGLPIIWGAGSEIVRVVRTSNSQLTGSNKGNLIDVTSGTFTQTFAACSTLGSGWFCYIRNNGTGDITLDPNANETIDGLTNYVMYPGEVRLVQCDGTSLWSVVLNAFYRAFTTSGTFIKPPGYLSFHVKQWAGGGSGRKDSAATGKSGGGGGACAEFDVLPAAISSSEAVTVGAGGTAQTANATNGNPGGTTTFAGVSVYGGEGGVTGIGANGGSAYFQNLFATTDNDGFRGGNLSSNSNQAEYGGAAAATALSVVWRGVTVHGGGGGGGIDGSDVLLTGGTTILGGSGGAASLSGNGADGAAPGGGGGATKTGAQSGAGARGEVRIWGVI